MPDQTTAISVTQPPEGMQLTPTDFLLLQQVIDNEVGRLLGSFGAINALPATNPVTLVPTSGMNIQAGGSGQVVIAQGVTLDTCPATTLTVAASGVADRVDLIAIKATRVLGSSTITRKVRSDTATPQLYPMSSTLVAGTKTVTLPTGYTVAPGIIGPFPVGLDSTADLRVVSVSTTQVVFQSDDSADTRSFSFLVAGNLGAGDPTGSTGVNTTITQYVNSPAWAYVQNTSGTPLVAPSPPSGYDAFATVYVHASETSVGVSDITYLFPPLQAYPPNITASPFSIPLPGGLTLRIDSQSAVSSADSTTTIAYSNSFAFGVATLGYFPFISTVSSASGTALTIQKFSPTATGFKVHVSGGSPGDTVTIDYLAIGY